MYRVQGWNACISAGETMTLRLSVDETKENLGLIIEPGTYKIDEILCCVSDRPIEQQQKTEGNTMNHLTPEPEQREYLERCKQAQQEIHDQIGKLKTDLFKCIGTIESIQSKCSTRPHTAEEILKMRDDRLRQAGVCIPQYERD